MNLRRRIMETGKKRHKPTRKRTRHIPIKRHIIRTDGKKV